MFKTVIVLANILSALSLNEPRILVDEINDLNAIMPEMFYSRRMHTGENGKILSDGGAYKFFSTSTEAIPSKYSVSSSGVQVIQNISEAIRSLVNEACVVLLDDRESVHVDGEIYMRGLLNDPGMKTDFWLMKFNNSGTTGVLAKSKEDKTAFANFLKYQAEKGKSTNYIGPEKLTGGVVFFSILKATRLLPVGGGIMVFTDRGVQDEDLAHLAVKELSDKHIKLFVVWQGSYPTVTNEEKLLREATEVSGGQFFIGNSERKLLNQSDYQRNATIHRQQQSTVLYRTGLRAFQHLTFPVDWKISEIRVTVTSVVKMVKMFTPRGYSIDLLDSGDVKKYSQGSDSVMIGENCEIRLNTADQMQALVVGTWRLDVSANNAHVYNVTISIQNDLSINAQLIDKYQKQSKGDAAETSDGEKILRLNIRGSFSTIEKVGFVNRSGVEIRKEVPFALKTSSSDASDSFETFSTQTIDVDADGIPEDAGFVRVQGKDHLGNQFVRLARYESERINNRLQTITIEVGAGSELLASPNKYSNIYFEVTNNIDQVITVDFTCRDERWLLQGMTPRGARINPKQTVIVTVHTYPQFQAGSGYRDIITFTARGTERAEKTAVMYVNTEKPVDNENPHLWYRFSSDCLNVLTGYCQDSTWSIDVTAQDTETGLMQLTSNPRALYFPNGYTTGTKEQVTGSFSGSCCQSQIQLTALDLNNNRRVLVADAYYNATLSPGIIAAIVLGVLLLIALIITVILVCRYRTRRSISIDLPTYRGPSQSSRRH